MRTQSEINELVNEITNFVNSFTPDEDGFIKSMSREHRTLQQSFTKLVLRWLEFVASDEYRYDGRNEASHTIVKELIETFLKNNHDINPSQFLPMI